ncbi:hypothetical protein L9F63_009988 [Diploptera punctata]|uniref:Uncharacterized protein n=1 Tax=Diploptera punctata TaxID=6984 RepID=A0AAD8ERB8_DIPPU|nr:hypothetical protein L9F63_009988 [Diploptera punctata]
MRVTPLHSRHLRRMEKMSTKSQEVELKFKKLFSTFTPFNLAMDGEDEWMAKMEKNLRSNFYTANTSDDMRSNEIPCDEESISLKNVPTEMRELASNFHNQMMKQVCTFTEMVFQQKKLIRNENTEEVCESLTTEVDKAKLLIQIQSLMAFISNKLNEYRYIKENKILDKKFE